jgi:hypothetical protein
VANKKYPPIPGSLPSGADEVEGSQSKKRARAPRKDGDEDKRAGKRAIADVAGNRFSVHIPTHTLYNKSVMDNDDPVGAFHFMQGLCPTPDWHKFEAMTDEEFTQSFAQSMSKVRILRKPPSFT